MRRISLTLIVLLLAACAAEAVPAQPAVPTLVKGYGLSPQGFPADYSQLPAFFAEVASLPNGGVMFNGAWRSDAVGGSDAGQIPQPAIAVMNGAEAGFTPIIVFGWRSEDANFISVPANPVNDWSNAQAADLFVRMVADFALQAQPPHLFLGNENDGYFISNPEDYANWITVYDRAYAAIKAASPQTRVGPVFQYERMSGQGTFSQWTESAWGALEAHDLANVDLVGITLYPWLGVATPEEIPADYLAPLLERIGDIPIAITETGWPGEDLGVETAWEQSESAQVRFVNALSGILTDVDVRVLNWLYLYPIADPQAATAFQTFGSISLRNAAGEKRPVYDLWAEFQP
jgi:hypothetical protein